MPILKFTFDNSKISLEKIRMEDISEDKRTQLLDKKSFLKKEYHIEHNVYMVVNDMFFKMSKFFNKTTTAIDAMLIRDEKDYIIIVPSRSYVFWNGRSVEPTEYKILDSEINIMKLLKI
jgi:hypothetical protein